MRHLDKAGIPYTVHEYEGGALPGMDVALSQGEDPREVFKTLVTESKDRRYYVFLVPVTGDLDLKKAAASVGEKSLSMIRSKDLLPLTGYVHGGCSPLCIRRPMRVTVDSTARDLERIYFSAGRVGLQIEMAVADLPRAMEFQFADVRKPRQGRRPARVSSLEQAPRALRRTRPSWTRPGASPRRTRPMRQPRGPWTTRPPPAPSGASPAAWPSAGGAGTSAPRPWRGPGGPSPPGSGWSRRAPT